LHEIIIILLHIKQSFLIFANNFSVTTKMYNINNICSTETSARKGVLFQKEALLWIAFHVRNFV